MALYVAGVARNYDDGGYDDWYLPSKDELNKLYLNKDKIGVFANDVYWSSSEYFEANAWYQYFKDPVIQDSTLKEYTFRVRAVRAF
jgi:hypothetical protein